MASIATPQPKKRSSDMDAAIRIVHILHILFERTPRTTNEIREQLKNHIDDVPHIRTIQRVMAELEGKFGVYRDDDYNWHINRQSFNELFDLDDTVAIALLVAEQQLTPITPPHMLQPLNGLFNQARAKLARSENALAHWTRRVCVANASHHLHQPQIHPLLHKAIQEAVLNHSVLRIDYCKHQGDEPVKLEVTALAIFYRGAVPYLICRDHGQLDERNEGIRQLPFSRIKDVAVSITGNPIVNGFDLEHYRQSGSLEYRFGEPFELTLEIFNSVRREVEDAHLGENQVIKPVEGHPNVFNMTVRVPYTLNLIQWLLARAPYLKVIGPADFKEKFYRELQLALQHQAEEVLTVPAQPTFRP